MDRLFAPMVPVHPHVCGELSLFWHTRPTVNGSSPRLWGTHKLPDSMSQKGRFIPTSVGNSVGIIVLVVKLAVHPHVCGELYTTVF